MKTTFFLSVLGLATAAVANPLPAAEGQLLEGKSQDPSWITSPNEGRSANRYHTARSCPTPAISSCQASCNSYALNICNSMCAGSNYNCVTACHSSRLASCKSCCVSKCAVC